MLVDVDAPGAAIQKLGKKLGFHKKLFKKVKIKGYDKSNRLVGDRCCVSRDVWFSPFLRLEIVVVAVITVIGL